MVRTQPIANSLASFKTSTMHQHPRSPAVQPPTPNVSSRPTSARPDDLRDQEPTIPSSPTADIRTHPTKGLGIEADAESADQIQRNAAPAKEAMAKLNQIISV